MLLPGSIVEGYVEVVCTQEVKVSAIRIKFAGKETVLFNNGNFRETMIYFQDLVTVCGVSKFEGFQISQSLMAGPSASQMIATMPPEQLAAMMQRLSELNSQGQSITMPVGTYQYPFAFAIPMNIPPSFYSVACSGSKSAEVAYSVTGVVDMPGTDADPEGSAAVSVLQMIDENQHLCAEPPQSVSFDSGPITFCCCVGKGSISGTMVPMNSSPVLGSGEPLELSVTLDLTNTSADVEAIEVSVLNVIKVQSVQQPHLSDTFCSTHNPLASTRVTVGNRGKVVFTTKVQMVVTAANIVPSTQTAFCSTSHRYCLKLVMASLVSNITIPEFAAVNIVQNVDHRNLYTTYGSSLGPVASQAGFIGLKCDGFPGAQPDVVEGSSQLMLAEMDKKKARTREFIYQCPPCPMVPLAAVPGSVTDTGAGVLFGRQGLNPYPSVEVGVVRPADLVVSSFSVY